MSQKLSAYIRLPWVKFPAIKTKAEVRREASKKAARTVKRMKQARLAAARAAKAEDKRMEAA